MTMLAACASPEIRHGVARPLQSAAPTTVFLPPVQVSSREQDADAQRRNREWGELLTGELRAVLDAQGRRLDDTAGQAIQARLHTVYGKTKLNTPNGVRWQPGFVEVQLELRDVSGSEVRYSTFAKTALTPSPLADWFGWGTDKDAFVRATIREAVAQFAAGLAPAGARKPASP